MVNKSERNIVARIHEIISENTKVFQTGSKTVPVNDIFGGGSLNNSMTSEMITATYTNKKGELEVKLTVTPKENRMFIKRNGGNIRGEEMDNYSQKNYTQCSSTW